MHRAGICELCSRRQRKSSSRTRGCQRTPAKRTSAERRLNQVQAITQKKGPGSCFMGSGQPQSTKKATRKDYGANSADFLGTPSAILDTIGGGDTVECR